MSAQMLSADRVSELLSVDPSTVYRMAAAGRLPAVKVGRQWRFPAHRIAALLHLDVELEPGGPTGSERPAATIGAAADSPVPRELAAALVDVAARALGVMMVVTDLAGRPLTEVANPCPAFADRAGDPALLLACTREWQALAVEPDLAPRFRRGALEFECARAFVRVGDRLVAMVLAGGVDGGVDGGNGDDGGDGSASGLYQLSAAERQRVLDALPNVAATLAGFVASPTTSRVAGSAP